MAVGGRGRAVQWRAKYNIATAVSYITVSRESMEVRCSKWVFVILPCHIACGYKMSRKMIKSSVYLKTFQMKLGTLVNIITFWKINASVTIQYQMGTLIAAPESKNLTYHTLIIIFCRERSFLHVHSSPTWSLWSLSGSIKNANCNDCQLSN